MQVTKDNDPVLLYSKTYRSILHITFALLPFAAILYINSQQEPGVIYNNYSAHELAIAFAIVLSIFATWVTWYCYRSTGELFLLWLALGLFALTVLYTPHGLFTRFSQHNLFLFLIFGPLSRLVMVICFFTAVLIYGNHADKSTLSRHSVIWAAALGVLVVIGTAAGVLALRVSDTEFMMFLLRTLETMALVLCLLTMFLMVIRVPHTPLMTIFLISLAFFAQASVAFLAGSPWNHQWWLAHIIFAGGFMVLSYGIVQAFLTTHSFSTVYSQEDMMEQLRRETERTEQALVKLSKANQQLKRLATTDSLTGAANHRQFKIRAEMEVARARRNELPMSQLAMDLDHFKEINDQYGHETGDEVLKSVVNTIQEDLRTPDLLARTGGEEFQILLPDTNLSHAVQIAERIRTRIESLVIETSKGSVQITVSIGCAELEDDPATMNRIADERLYKAKQQGRNCVVAI